MSKQVHEHIPCPLKPCCIARSKKTIVRIEQGTLFSNTDTEFNQWYLAIVCDNVQPLSNYGITYHIEDSGRLLAPRGETTAHAKGVTKVSPLFCNHTL